MSIGRIFEVGRHELAFNFRRPMLWVLIALLTLMVWGLSAGNVRISSGDSTVGGTEAHITSQFSQAQTLSVTILTMYAFFLAVRAGMAVIRDQEHKLGEILHATLLTPAEYVWGKFLAVLAAFGLVMTLHLTAAAFFNHVLADAASAEYIGPFAIGNYVVPALAFGVPVIVFLGGVAFATGEISRRPILVFLFPVVVLLGTLTFLLSWSPAWLSPTANRFLMLIDPSGFRWLNETWLKVDRGVEFYNTSSITFDTGFVLSRLAFVVAGLRAVALSQRHFARNLSGVSEEGTWARLVAAVGRLAPWRRDEGLGESVAVARARVEPDLTNLAMTAAPPGFVSTVSTIARAEVRELLTRPGLYLFVPLIMIQATGNIVTTVAAFDAPALLTPGNMAVGMLNTLNLLVCFLLLFYMVESLQREYSAGFAPVFYSTPVRTDAILLGKALGTSLVGVLILLAMLAVCLTILLWQQLFGSSPVAISTWPFLLTWGVVLVPTFIVWCAFVLAVYGLTRSRYTTYAIGIVALAYTVWRQVFGEGLTWLTNWLGWGAVLWSDMGLFPLNGRPLLWNRLFVLSLAVLLVALAVRWYGRQEQDPQRVFHRLYPRQVALSTLRLLPALVVPLVLGVFLWTSVEAGYQSETEERVQKDYWRRNFATWRDAKQPAPLHVELEPTRRWMRVEGTYRLANQHEETLENWAVTPGRTDEITWTLGGEEYEPEDRAGLQVFDRPLAPGDVVEIGFSYETLYPQGYNRTGGGAGTFVLDAGVVLTSFGPQWVPTVGYIEQVGIDEDNSFEPREYPDDFYEGITPNGFGLQGRPYTTRIRVTAPEEYLINSVGVLVHDDVERGRRTVVWESDHPVTFFNLVAGRWAVHEGDGTAVYYHPEHTYNIDEIGMALDAARKYYSEWFYPYPWQLLKLSEFPALAGYAQGFPANITFSEGIGFLTRSDPRAPTAFMVTAHEAAHQWWGNLLTPGLGPGGNILSEGMSHFSTILLTEQVLGEGHRIEVAKRFETRYADGRQVDSERPMVKIDGSRRGDRFVTYEKGGWVAWMLMDLMGREAMLAGLNEFIATFNPSPDYPVLQDLVATLRPHASDPEAFDAFVEQWFFDVVVPEYRLSDAAVEPDGHGWKVTASIENVGEGTMPVQIAATLGVRFPELLDEDEAAVTAGEEYRDARVTVRLGAGESQNIEILIDFEPDKLVVDPDVLVLQLRRERAEVGIGGQ